MKKTRILLSSIVVIAMCVSLIVGSTFALFTSESNVNIAVTSGKVNVVATVGELVTTSAVWTQEGYVSLPTSQIEGGANGTFTNGGTATVIQGRTLSLENITPGDGVTFSIDVTNNSDISIKYETVITLVSAADTKLFEGLAIEVNNAPVNKKLSTSVTDWSAPVAPLGQIAPIDVSVGLPIDAGNEYMTNADGEQLVCELSIGVYAIQANGNDETYQNVALVSSVEEFVDKLSTVEAGDVLMMNQGDYPLQADVLIPSGVSLVGAQAGTPAVEWMDDPDVEKTVICASDELAGSRLIQIVQEGDAVSDVVLDGIMVDCNDKDVKGIFARKGSGSAMQGIEIKNCAVTNCKNDAIDIQNTDGAVIEGNYVQGFFDNGIQLGSYNNTQGPAYIRNNIIDGATGTINGAIAICGGTGDVIVSGNTLKNIKSKHAFGTDRIDLGESSIVVEGVYGSGTIVIENNTLENVEQGIAVTKFATLSDAERDTVIVRNNTINEYTTFAIAVTLLNDVNRELTTVVSVLDNTITSQTEGVGALYIGYPNHYSLTSTNWTTIASGNTVNGEDGDWNKEYNF